MNKVSKKKDEHGKEEKLANLQAFNDIKSILSQITATNNPAELSRLANQASSLKSDNQLINDIIEKVQNTIIKKQEAIEKQLNSEHYIKDLEELQKQIQEKEIKEYKLKVTEKIKELNTKHSNFKKNIEEYKRLSPPIEEMVKKDSNGEIIIDEKAIDKNILTCEEVEEHRQKLAELKEYEKEVNEVFEKANNEKEQLEKEIKSLEKTKGQNLTIEQIKEVESKLKLNHAKLAENKVLMEEAQSIRQHVKINLDKIKLANEKDRVKIDQLEEALVKTENTRSSDKQTQLKQKHSLISCQHEAIVNNKELSIEDRNMRENTVNQIKVQHKCDNIKKSLNNSGTEKTTPNNSNVANTKQKGWER